MPFAITILSVLAGALLSVDYIGKLRDSNEIFEIRAKIGKFIVENAAIGILYVDQAGDADSLKLDEAYFI